MDHDIFKAPRAKKRPAPNPKPPVDIWNGRKRRRTKEDFIQFCNFVLDYTNYESMRNEDSRVQQNTSPIGSGGSPVDSYSSDSSNVSPAETRQASPSQTPYMSPPPPPAAGANNMIRSQRKYSPNSASSSPRSATDIESDEDSYELITCFCMKPFAGRPMIECNECLTWIHLSCAKIRKTNIPEEFTCQKCKDAKLTTRKSTRQRVEKQNLDA